MKKTLLSLALAIGAAAMMQAKGNGDQVLMTINNKPVTLSEFEYLFHKNNSQQVTPQSIDDYLQMFITYKQKVAEAEAEGIDKSQAFQNEFDGYRRDLAEPYLRIQEVEDSLVNAIYDRMKEEVDVSHIMIANHGEGIEREAQKTRLDSIRTAILNGSDFAELARRFSIDRSVVRNGGHMGYITAAKIPLHIRGCRLHHTRRTDFTRNRNPFRLPHRESQRTPSGTRPGACGAHTQTHTRPHRH